MSTDQDQAGVHVDRVQVDINSPVRDGHVHGGLHDSIVDSLADRNTPDYLQERYN